MRTTASFVDVRRRVIKEKAKQVAKPRISKQQRNIRKKETRKDLQADLF